MQTAEKALKAKNELLKSLMQAPHGDLMQYNNLLATAHSDKDLFAHFIAWNNKHSKIKDSKCALPILALRTFNKTEIDYAHNALAALMLLSPRELVKAYQYSKSLSSNSIVISGGWRKKLQECIQQYLECRENIVQWWDSAVVRNRKAMLELYTISHKKPSDRAQKILFEKQYPSGGVFEVIKHLKDMPIDEACQKIIKYQLPLSVIAGSGVKIKDNQNVLLALIESLTGNELINSTNMLKSLGAFNYAATRAAYDAAVERAKDDKRVNVFKASKAVEKVKGPEAKKLIQVQRQQAETLNKIEGDVLILADASGSMSESLQLARKIAGVITSQVKGNQYLIFFNENPRFFNVTGLDFDQIQQVTKGVRAGGQTSIGCGLKYLIDKNIQIDLILIVSDGGDNHNPLFFTAYKQYVEKFNNEPNTILFRVKGDCDRLLTAAGDAPFEKIEIDASFDVYSLPNILSTIKISRYELLNEVLDTPLLTLHTVFSKS